MQPEYSHISVFPKVKDNKDNFLMKRLAKDKNALRISDEKPEAQLAEEDNKKHIEDKRSDSSPGSNTIKQNGNRIIPFSEFMKEKTKSGYNAPSKIPIPSAALNSANKSPPRKEDMPFSRSPKAGKIDTNFAEKGTPLQRSKKELNTAPLNNPKAGKYFQTLKNKFSPSGEQGKATKSPLTVELGTKKRATRQPNQHNYYHQKYQEEPLSFDGQGIKSQEDSKKSIIKVAGNLKKKLKHNFEFSKDPERLLTDQNEETYSSQDGYSPP